ncbi:MAG: hypothetical protein GYB68_01055 [Chloroflexi bacterium]|nr:hypothetical protein [Chloroflexota bacterium]
MLEVNDYSPGWTGDRMTAWGDKLWPMSSLLAMVSPESRQHTTDLGKATQATT